MKLELAYGEAGLTVELPDGAVVVEPADPEPIPDERAAVTEALRRPLGGPSLVELVRSAGRRSRVVVVFPDLTRPMPNRTVLPPLLEELRAAGAEERDVTLLCATGTHRAATPAEMDALVGPEVVERYRVHDHRADDGDHLEVGRVDGTPVLLDRRWVEADVRLVTGFVEPHFFAGYSGGPKGVCPGLAALPTILEAHSPARIADPAATWAVTRGNPVHDFVRAAADLCPPDLSLDVTIDGRRRLTSVWAGRLPVSHEAACAFLHETAARLPGRGDGAGFDVVLSTNGGHPLDRNLYQAVKGMAAAERLVKPGGTIVMAARCADGLPDGGFAEIVRTARTPEELLRPAGPGEVDRWQAQVLGRVLRRARVLLYSEGLSAEQAEAAQLEPVTDVGRAVGGALDAAGEDPSLAVLPRGPLTLVA